MTTNQPPRTIVAILTDVEAGETSVEEAAIEIEELKEDVQS